ncbi:MAG TPA: DsrE/DsrF/DrsH-like family protein [Burkholderiaceae bacterium]|nr:DsrE/DsrF/DrsH-like family protein [Burkholderiaceae bacterium]
MGAGDFPAGLDELIAKRVDELIAKKIEERMAQLMPKGPPSMTIIATKGTLDWAYPPYILASAGAALGWDVAIFHTFYGLKLLLRDLSQLRVSPLGNPAMPMKMPFGPRWFRQIRWNMPNAVASVVPGFEAWATNLMKQTFKSKGVASIEELRQTCIDADVKLIACQMTVDAFGFQPQEFIPEVSEFCGATRFLPLAQTADVNLLI